MSHCVRDASISLIMRIFDKFLLLAFPLVVTSCVSTEPLNSECDILSVTLPGDILSRTPDIENNRVTLIVKNSVSLSRLAPEFTLTPGASINPPGGSALDFTRPQLYTTTSEDGQWHKEYTISAQHLVSIQLKYDFEDVNLVKTSAGGIYDEFYSTFTPEGSTQSVTTIWASGNSGFALTNGKNGPDTYPTYQYLEGKDGKCACLITRSTGAWGAMVNKPIAAGSLFLGKFDSALAVARQLEATKFGVQFMNIPSSFSGWYQYTPGDIYTEFDEDAKNKLKEVPGKEDRCNIYAVFFESTSEMEYLDGTNVLAADNPNIIAVAQLDDSLRGKTSGWNHFDIPFVFREGKEVDPKKLDEGRYSLAIIMTSSEEGDYFSGAIGSRLLVDELFIQCQ